MVLLAGLRLGESRRAKTLFMSIMSIRIHLFSTLRSCRGRPACTRSRHASFRFPWIPAAPACLRSGAARVPSAAAAQERDQPPEHAENRRGCRGGSIPARQRVRLTRLCRPAGQHRDGRGRLRRERPAPGLRGRPSASDGGRRPAVQPEHVQRGAVGHQGPRGVRHRPVLRGGGHRRAAGAGDPRTGVERQSVRTR